MVNTQQNRHLTDNEMHTLKGFSRLRFKSAEESLDDAKTSVRRWWWEFLRLSKDYWLICQTSKPYRIETQDERLADIYRYWGDIYSCTFEEWWLDRGPSVFMEKEAFPRVKEISRKPRERLQTKMLEDHLWVDIPLKLSKRTIQRQLGKILEEHGGGIELLDRVDGARGARVRLWFPVAGEEPEHQPEPRSNEKVS